MVVRRNPVKWPSRLDEEIGLGVFYSGALPVELRAPKRPAGLEPATPGSLVFRRNLIP